LGVRLGLCLLVAVTALAACGGEGDGDGAFGLSPSSGAPGTELSIGQGCDDPPLTAEWTDAAGGSIFSASPSEDSENGITYVPDVAAGTYGVTVTCGNAFVGEATFDVTG